MPFFAPFAFIKQEAGDAPAPPALLLLDEFPGAGVAFSTRLLRAGYTGNCMEVRRSSDNATLNIGFVDNVLDTASLLTFCGAGNGFVVTWYNQTADAGRDAFQATDGTQPRIVTDGVVLTENGKPGVICPEAPPDFMLFNAVIPQPNTTFIAAKSDASFANHFYDTTSRQLIGYGSEMLSFAGSSVINYGTAPNTFQLVSAIFDGASSVFQSNDDLNKTGNPGSAGITNGTTLLGTIGGGMCEFIIYPSNKSADKEAIKTSINSFYSIF